MLDSLTQRASVSVAWTTAFTVQNQLTVIDVRMVIFGISTRERVKVQAGSALSE